MLKSARLRMCLAAFLLVMLASPIVAQPVQAGDICQHTLISEWNIIEHWSCGHIPGPEDTVIILPGADVVLDGSHQVAELHIGGNIIGGPGQSITVSTKFEWSQGELRGPWVLELSPGSTGGLSADDPALYTRLQQTTINNRGTFTVKNPAGIMGSNGGSFGTINNYGMFIVQRGNLHQHTFNNHAGAVLAIKAPPSPAPFVQVGPLTNIGKIQIESGTLELTRGSTQTGPVEITAGGTMAMTNYPVNLLNPGFSVTGAGTVGLYGGNIQLGANVTIPRLALTGSSGGIDGAGYTLTIPQMFYWNGGIVQRATLNLLAGSANTLADSPDPMYLNGPSVINNAGTLTMNRAGGLTYSFGPGTIRNTGLFKINRGSITAADLYNEPAGVLEVDLGEGVTAQLNAHFHDQGMTFLKTGIFQLMGNDGADINGDITLTPGSTLELKGGGRMLGNDATIVGAGTLLVSGGNNNLNWPPVFSIGTFKQTGGIAYVRNMTLTGNLVVEGGEFYANDAPGTVLFNAGSGLQQKFTAKVPVVFTDIEVAGNTILTETETANNVTITGELINNGTVKKMLPISGAGVYTFGITGASLNLTSAGSLTTLTASQVGMSHPNAGTITGTGRYWTFAATPTGASGYTANLTLPHHQSPLFTMACRYSGAATTWNCGADEHTVNSVTLNSITSLTAQPFAVADLNLQSELNLSMTADKDHILVGETVTYTTKLRNEGPGRALDARVVYWLPEGMTLVSATATRGACELLGTNIDCPIGTVEGHIPAAATSFDGLAPTDTLGWTVSDNARNLRSTGAGGYLRGYLAAEGTPGDAPWYFRAPESYLGDRGFSYGKRLTFYLKQPATGAPSAGADVIIEGAGLTLTFDAAHDPSTDWTYYEIPLEYGLWKNHVTGQIASESEIRAALANITQLGIRGSHYTGVAAAMLDQVTLEAPGITDIITIKVMATKVGQTQMKSTVYCDTEGDIANNTAYASVAVMMPVYLPVIEEQ